MKVVIAGGTGFLGRALVDAWRKDGHQVFVLTRRPRQDDDIRWSTEANDTSWFAAIDGADAVVNLAGEGIADKRWTDSRKAAILDSRVRATRALTALSRGVRAAPPSSRASAIGPGNAHALYPCERIQLASAYDARVPRAYCSPMSVTPTPAGASDRCNSICSSLLPIAIAT